MSKTVLVIGGGIVGLSTAMQILDRFPDFRVTLVEKESDLAKHQTGHNSGVVHAGVYYTPGSLKAKFCRAGAEATRDFCRKHSLPFDQCGKLIVATDEQGLQRLGALEEKCLTNGLSPERLDAKELSRREPNVVGKGAIFVAASGIADYPAIARTMAVVFKNAGGEIKLDTRVLDIREDPSRVAVESTAGTLSGDYVVVCGGLQADRLASMCGIDLNFRIVPFRGEYYRLPAAKNDVVRHLIYPVPDPSLPFLGVHLTRMIGGYVTVGPNAVLALAREGYDWSTISVSDLTHLVGFPGFWRVMKVHGRSGANEIKNSIFKRGYLAECQKYCPQLVLDDLQPYPAGVRAQAVLRDGTLVQDFLMRNTKRTFHVCNAPSPAATSALPIGRHIVDRVTEIFELGSEQELLKIVR
jgi:L-2-hydroxyglutarate oxidase